MHHSILLLIKKSLGGAAAYLACSNSHAICRPRPVKLSLVIRFYHSPIKRL